MNLILSGWLLWLVINRATEITFLTFTLILKQLRRENEGEKLRIKK